MTESATLDLFVEEEDDLVHPEADDPGCQGSGCTNCSCGSNCQLC